MINRAIDIKISQLSEKIDICPCSERTQEGIVVYARIPDKSDFSHLFCEFKLSEITNIASILVKHRKVFGEYYHARPRDISTVVDALGKRFVPLASAHQRGVKLASEVVDNINKPKYSYYVMYLLCKIWKVLLAIEREAPVIKKPNHLFPFITLTTAISDIIRKGLFIHTTKSDAFREAIWQATAFNATREPLKHKLLIEIRNFEMLCKETSENDFGGAKDIEEVFTESDRTRWRQLLQVIDAIVMHSKGADPGGVFGSQTNGK